ncbi:MAG: hypothetical protein MJ092_04930, partial [Lachnospiraceae bacterium]|nr:hypothetical protein [Lachnospiraceae bacterium]
MDFTKVKNNLEKNGFTVSVFDDAQAAAAYLDKEIDGVFKKFNAVPKNFIIDSRMAFFFVPSSIKIKLNVDVKTA